MIVVFVAIPIIVLFVIVGTIADMMDTVKRLALTAVVLVALSGCGDRERVNCPRTKNQVMTRTTTDTPTTTTSTIEIDGRCV